MCKSPTNTVHDTMPIPTPRAGDSAKKRRLTKEEVLALSKDLLQELAGLEFPDSPYSSEEDSSPSCSNENVDSVSPMSPPSPVRRRSNGSVAYMPPMVAEPCGHAQRLRTEEQAVVQAATGERNEFVRAKRRSNPREAKTLESPTRKEAPAVQNEAPTAPALSLQPPLSCCSQKQMIGHLCNPCKYLLADSIGEGSASTVRRGTDLDSGRHVAVKTLLRDMDSVAGMEVSAMQACAGHPHVLQLLDEFVCNGETHIVSELASSDLLEHLQEHGPLSEDQARVHCRGLLSALNTLHNAGFCHRDVKLENLLLAPDKRLLLCDMGTAATTNHRHVDAVGSMSYMAPEVVAARNNSGNDYDGAMADVHSSGVVLYACCAGVFPFELASPQCGGYQRLLQGEHQWPNHFSVELTDLLQSMLGCDECQRSTPKQLLQHRWFTECPSSCA